METSTGGRQFLLKSEAGFKCLDCDSHFQNVSRHLSTKHPLYRATDVNLLVDRTKYCEPVIIDGFGCVPCGKAFKYLWELERHMEGKFCTSLVEGERGPKQVLEHCTGHHTLILDTATGSNAAGREDGRLASTSYDFDSQLYPPLKKFRESPCIFESLFETASTDQERYLRLLKPYFFLAFGEFLDLSAFNTWLSEERAKMKRERHIHQEFIQTLRVGLDDVARAVPYLPGVVRGAILNFSHVDSEHTNGTFTVRKDNQNLAGMLSDLLSFTGYYSTAGKPPPVHMFLLEMAEEMPTSAMGDLPCLSRFCLLQAFNSSGTGLVTPHTVSKSLSAVLYILRLMLVYRIIPLNGKGWMDQQVKLCTSLNDQWFVQWISPLMRNLRGIGGDVSTTRPCDKIKMNGDLLINGQLFQHKYWSQIIPRIFERCESLLEMVLHPEKVAELLDPNAVLEIELKDLTLSNGRVTPLVALEGSNDAIAMSQLGGYLYLSLQTTGLGATRASESHRAKKGDCELVDNSLRYKIYVMKKGTYFTNVDEKNPVRHTLPSCIARILFIYRSLLSPELRDKDELIPTTTHSYDQRWAMKEVFDLMELPTNLDIRHAVTDILNILFGVTKNVDEEVAESAGHGVRVHMQYYVTPLDECDACTKFHTAVGETADLQFTHKEKALSDKDLLIALQTVVGVDQFRTHQKEALTCLLEGRSVHLSQPCGWGKSTLWLVLSALSKVRGGTGASLVVIPYQLLLNFFLEEALQHDLSAEVVTNAGSLNSFSLESCPSILFVCLDRFAEILTVNRSNLKSLIESKCIRRIFIDETHLLFTELNFRPNFGCLQGIGSLGCPIATMSGSLPVSLTKGLLSYMGVSAMSVQLSGSSLGLNGIPITLNKNFSHSMIDRTISILNGRLGKGSVHIIMASKSGSHFYLQKLRDRWSDTAIELVTSDTEPLEKLRIAKDWKQGKIEIFVTTSCGLVGNSSDGCRTVIFCGCPYNLPQVVQSMGRLRPKQREGCHYEIILQEGYGEQSENTSILCDTFEKFVNPSQMVEFAGHQSLLEWLNASGCRMQALSVAMGLSGCQRCMICDNCVARLASVARNPYARKKIASSSSASTVSMTVSSRGGSYGRATLPGPPPTFHPTAPTTFSSASRDSSQRGERVVSPVPFNLPPGTPTPCQTIRFGSQQSVPSPLTVASSLQNESDRARKQRNVERTNFLIESLKAACFVCGGSDCDGKVHLPRNSCFICGGPHQRRQCPIGEKLKLFKACYICWGSSLVTEHPFGSGCPIQGRLRALIYQRVPWERIGTIKKHYFTSAAFCQFIGESIYPNMLQEATQLSLSVALTPILPPTHFDGELSVQSASARRQRWRRLMGRHAASLTVKDCMFSVGDSFTRSFHPDECLVIDTSQYQGLKVKVQGSNGRPNTTSTIHWWVSDSLPLNESHLKLAMDFSTSASVSSVEGKSLTKSNPSMPPLMEGLGENLEPLKDAFPEVFKAFDKRAAGKRSTVVHSLDLCDAMRLRENSEGWSLFGFVKGRRIRSSLQEPWQYEPLQVNGQWCMVFPFITTNGGKQCVAVPIQNFMWIAFDGRKLYHNMVLNPEKPLVRTSCREEGHMSHCFSR